VVHGEKASITRSLGGLPDGTTPGPRVRDHGFGLDGPRRVDWIKRQWILELDPSLAAIREVRDKPGQWLYHYTTLETALVHILSTLRLRLSPFLFAYAGAGSGVCVVLRKQDAVGTLPQQLLTVGRFAHGAVRYQNAPINREIMFNFEEILAGDVEAIADRIAERHLDALFLTKNTEWENEREYRFITRSAQQYEYVDIASCLHAVCRGPESARTADHALRHFATELGIGIGLVQWDNNRPVLIGRPLDSASS
jgi:Protein of unknown function (DUF2971)